MTRDSGTGSRSWPWTGFGGYKNAAVTAMEPFHVVALAGQKLDPCRQRVQRHICAHRGRAGDPLYRVRRALGSRLELLTDKQRTKPEAVFADEEHVALTTT